MMEEPKKMQTLTYIGVIALALFAVAFLVMSEVKEKKLENCQQDAVLTKTMYENELNNTNKALDICYVNVQERIAYAENHSTNCVED